MKNFEDLRRWLDNGISANPLAIHGTSIEAVFELAKTGRLPPGIPRGHLLRDDERTENRLFFMPVDHPKFQDQIYDKLVTHNRKDSLKDASDYAEFIGFTNYLASKISCRTSEVYGILMEWRSGDLEGKEIQDGLRKHGLKLSLRRINALDYHASKRKGVLIEANELILELPHQGKDEHLSFVCPYGLDAKYINGIELLGPVEKRLMERYLQGRLKYRGFITETA